MTTPQGKELEFTVVREVWSEYRLKDEGSKVKAKVALTQIIDTGKKKGKMKQLMFGTKNLFFKEQTPNDKGEPSGDPRISEEDIIQDLEFEKISEPTNVYDVPDKFTLISVAKMKSMKKTKKFDAQGNRIYHFDLEIALSVVPYPK